MQNQTQCKCTCWFQMDETTISPKCWFMNQHFWGTRLWIMVSLEMKPWSKTLLLHLFLEKKKKAKPSDADDFLDLQQIYISQTATKLMICFLGVRSGMVPSFSFFGKYRPGRPYVHWEKTDRWLNVGRPGPKPVTRRDQRQTSAWKTWGRKYERKNTTTS